MTYYGNNNIRRVAERLRREREARDEDRDTRFENYRAFAEQEPSAPVQASDLSGEYFTRQSQVLSAGESGPVRSIEQVQKEQDQRRRKVYEQISKEQQKYIDDVQMALFDRIRQIQQKFEKTDAEEESEEQIHRLKDINLQKGSYINLLSNKGPIKEGKALYSSFVHATPQQLAMLVPLLRFFMVDKDGNEREIYFSDYTTGEYAARIANLRSDGDINTLLEPREQRGSDAGIRSFTWNYYNKHEGDFIIEAELELYFGTLAELANINYLQFLFPTGSSVALAEEIDKASSAIKKGESSRNKGSNPRLDKILKLSETIETYKKEISKKASDQVKIKKLREKTTIAARKKEFRQLKVVVGWSVPGGNQDQLARLFKSNAEYAAFIESLNATNKAIFLNLADYNVEFQQEGPTTLSLKYLGSSDNYLATASSDVFGSNNLEDDENEFLYRETEVAIDGFIQIEGNILDIRNSTKESLSKQEGEARTVDQSVSKEPYLQSIIKTQGGTITNSLGQETIAVTLAGLRAAQELQSLELQLLQLQQVDEESSEFTLVRLRGQLLTLLYERAETIRLRDIYSRFLDNLIRSEYVHKAVISKDEVGKLKVKFDPVKELLKRDSQRIKNKILKPVGSEEASNVDPQKDTVVYYMRLGDILKNAMRTSGLREDISLILGNTSRLEQNHSIYDIPITVDNFGQFFYNRIVSRRIKSFPFRYFMNDMLKATARIVNQDPKIYDRIAFDYTVVSGDRFSTRDLGFLLDKGDLEKIGKSQENPLANAGLKFQHFYPIFETNTSHKGRVGDREKDEAEGIYHYVIGSDRGLAKTYNFSRQDTRYFQEMLIESNNLDDKIQALFLPQNVTLTLYGNTLHKNGDLIFIDSRPSLGSFAGPVLGIGGYYRVIRSTHQISNRGYETNLDCVFELRVTPDKTRRRG
tara:strand:+ start:1582 stop:4359 length:2778 start_codon:yes stop_codon:yes gene_type:complete